LGKAYTYLRLVSMSVSGMSLEREKMLELCKQGSRLTITREALGIFHKLFLAISALPMSQHAAIFDSTRYIGLMKRDVELGVVSADEFYFKKFIRGYSEDQLRTHLHSLSTKINKLDTMFETLMDKVPSLVVERDAVMRVLQQKMHCWASDEMAVTKIQVQFEAFEKKQAEKKRKLEESAELLISGLRSRQADMEEISRESEEAWKTFCINQGLHEAESDEKHADGPQTVERKSNVRPLSRNAQLMGDEPLTEEEGLSAFLQATSLQGPQ